MQADNNEIYRLTAERSKLPYDLYKDLGNFVFKSLSDNMKNPKSIILKLKGLGYWYLRKGRIEYVAKKDIPIPAEDVDKTRYNDKIELQNIFKKRLGEYEKYIEIRNEIKRIRNENITRMESSDRKDEGSETSKIDME